MTKTPDELKHDFEVLTDQIGSELQAITTILQVLLHNLIGGSPNPETAMQKVRAQVADAIEASIPYREDQHGSERRKQLQAMRASQILDEIAESLGLPRTKPDPSASN